jgi:hypothetical protein
MLNSSEILRKRMEDLISLIRERIQDRNLLEMAERIYLGLPPMGVDSQDSVPIVYPVIEPTVYTAKTSCRVCGIDAAHAMGYVCNNSKCPTRITCT